MILIALSLYSYRTTELLVERGRWVGHAHEEVAKIHELHSYVAEIHAGVRGFLITGREEFLLSYAQSVNRLNSAEEALQRLKTGTPRQEEWMTKLHELIQERLTFARRSIDLYRSAGAGPTAELIATGRGQELM